MGFRLTLLRLLAVFALGMCGVILANDLFAGAFCAFDSGCETVTSSAYSRVLGVPWSAVGVLGFALVLGLALFPQRRCFALVPPLALAAGVTGVLLILLQFLVLGQTCNLCLLVDGTAGFLAGVALAGKLPGEPVSWPRRSAWLGAAAVAIMAPSLFAWLNTAFPAPEKIMSYWVKGKVTIVEVTDFDCVRCREAERILQAFLKEQGDQVHFVRVVAPMPRLAHSRSAARAYLAARAQGKEEAMAAALFAAPGRHPQGCRDLAKSIGLDLEQYDKVVNDPATNAELEANLAWAKSHAPGLPAIWAQGQRIFGVPSMNSLRAASQRAKSHSAGRTQEKGCRVRFARQGLRRIEPLHHVPRPANLFVEHLSSIDATSLVSHLDE
jgi:uncharacterized membrane protein